MDLGDVYDIAGLAVPAPAETVPGSDTEHEPGVVGEQTVLRNKSHLPGVFTCLCNITGGVISRVFLFFCFLFANNDLPLNIRKT